MVYSRNFFYRVKVFILRLFKLVANETECCIAQPAGAVEHTDYKSAEGLDTTFNECPTYDMKQSDVEALVLEIWGNIDYPFIVLAPFKQGVVAPDRILFIGQIELFDHLTCANT